LVYGTRRQNKIGRITPAGVITEFAVPTTGDGPDFICVGPDGNLWFTREVWKSDWKNYPFGVIALFSSPSGGGFGGITTGPDGNLWFLESSINKVAKAALGGFQPGNGHTFWEHCR